MELQYFWKLNLKSFTFYVTHWVVCAKSWRQSSKKGIGLVKLLRLSRNAPRYPFKALKDFDICVAFLSLTLNKVNTESSLYNLFFFFFFFTASRCSLARVLLSPTIWLAECNPHTVYQSNLSKFNHKVFTLHSQYYRSCDDVVWNKYTATGDSLDWRLLNFSR